MTQTAHWSVGPDHVDDPAVVATYLAELDLRELEYQAPSSAGLKALHRAHVERFSHDTVWIARERIPAVDVREMVTGLLAGEGGVCTQLGFAFGWLLHQLGYNTRLHQARVQLTLDPEFRAWPQHPVLTIRVDGDIWYADVGMGNGLLDPIPCVDGPVSQTGGFTYWLERTHADTDTWEFRQDRRMRGVRRLQFDTISDGLVDGFRNGFHQMVTASDSPFRNTIGASRRDAAGVSLMMGDTLTRVDDAGRHRRRIESATEWESALREEFRLELPGWSRFERDRLWERVAGDGG